MTSPVDPAVYEGKFDDWLTLIAANHQAANHRPVERQAFQPLSKPLTECKVALVSSAGVHLAGQTPFNVDTVDGDSTYRLLPDDLDMGELRFIHTHYDTASAQADPNVVFPLDRLHEAADDGRIGSTSPVHVGLMGFNPDPTRIADETAPAIVSELEGAHVDAVVMVPG